MKNLAPIALSAYSRLEHLKKTVETLKNNYLAKESQLYVFSDAPKKGDENKVKKVREYLPTIEGFKEVIVFYRKKNSIKENNRGGIKYLLDSFGKCIFLEEDIVTAPGFLIFMNEALDLYKNNKNIFSVTGYSPPIKIPKDYNDQVFRLNRFNAWGMGIWKDRYDSIKDINYKEYQKFIKQGTKVRSFKQKAGEDFLLMLQKEAKGDLDALDVRSTYKELNDNLYTVYPRESLVKNIGHDGSGLHCKVNSKFDVELWDKINFNLPKNPKLDKRIVKSNYKFRKIPVRWKFSLFLKNLGVHSILKSLINKN